MDNSASKNVSERSVLRDLISAARGVEKADLVLKNARFLNVFTGRLEDGDIAIRHGYIAGIGKYSGEKEIDVSGKIVLPGLIDGHIHIESSMITPSEFAKIAIPHGTTTVIADPHEIANVAGIEGISYMIDNSRDLPLDVYYNIPSCVPATGLDESGAELDAASMEPLYGNDHVLGLAELMNSYGTVRNDEEILSKILGAKKHGRIIDGHAPGASGYDLNAYVAAGVGSDHECTTAEEAIEKLSRGQWIMIREGTSAKNLSALLDLCDEPYCDRCLLVTDDKHPGDIIAQGHIDFIIREAVKAGKKPENVIKMASFNAATYFGLKDRGAIAPGYLADLIVVSDLSEIRVEKVFKRGELAAEDGKALVEDTSRQIRKEDYPRVYQSFHLRPLVPEDFEIREKGAKKRVIELVPGQLLTKEAIVSSEETGDIIKVAVIERHKDTGHIGVGFVKGYGLKKGAVASSIAHDSHNLIVAGTNEADMALAANAVRENGGGLAVVSDGKVLSTLALPVGGLMCECAGADVEETLLKMKEQAREMGVPEGIDPFMTLAFTALPVIPKLRILTRGVVDVDTQSYVPELFD